MLGFARIVGFSVDALGESCGERTRQGGRATRCVGSCYHRVVSEGSHANPGLEAMITRLLVCAALVGSVLSAQTTWIVNAGGGAGVHFADLPTAVAAASDGDTIVVQTGPFQEGATPFVTSKGLTIVGEGGLVPITTSLGNAIEIVNLPATSTFRMVGFARLSNGALDVRVLNCAGKVHLERMRCREPGAFLPVWPSVEIYNSDNVTMRQFETFGSPCVQIDGSRVSMVSCRLGQTHIGLGGGQAVVANYSTVDIIEPLFEPVVAVAATVAVLQSDVRIAGSSGSLVNNGTGPAVLANGGSLLVDAAVEITGVGLFGAAFAGSTPPTFASLPASSTGNANPGQALVLRTAAQASSLVFTAIGQPGFLLDTPLGTLGIAVSQGYGFLPMAVVPALGPAQASLALPAALPLGSAYTTQSVVFQAGQLMISQPCTFVLH